MNDTKTVSGNIVHIEDGSEAPVLSLKVAITPKQSGTGTPSPDNVRPISGWESVNVTVSPTQDAQDGTTTTTALGRTVYGGTLDVVSGVLTVDRAMVTFDGSSDERIDRGSYGMAFRTYLPNDFKSTTNTRELAGLVSNQMTEVTQASTWGMVGTCALIANTNQLYFKLADELTDISELRTYLASNPLQVVYPLAQPQTYQLTPTEVNTLLGENNVWADAGAILEMTYRTEMLGIFGKIMIDGRPYFRPNSFELKREDVYAGEYTTCTGKLIADKIGWKFSDLAMKWDILPDDDLLYLSTLTGTFNIIFRDSDGQHTETVIRKGFTNTPTRITGPDGTAIWTGVEMEVTFINVHNN